MENKVKNVLSGIGFYGTLAVCLLVVGVCGCVLLQDREDPLSQQAVTPQVPVSQPVEMPEVRLPTVETLEPAPVPVPPKETKELPEVEVDHTPVAAEAPRLVVTPLQGDVLTAFSMEELVYSPTLGDWRTHNGVDIAAQQGTTVLAASAGAVLSVTDDPLMAPPWCWSMTTAIRPPMPISRPSPTWRPGTRCPPADHRRGGDHRSGGVRTAPSALRRHQGR